MAKEREQKKGKCRRNWKPYRFTYEIVPSGSLKRIPGFMNHSPKDRWKEIADICSEIISIEYTRSETHQDSLKRKDLEIE